MVIRFKWVIQYFASAVCIIVPFRCHIFTFVADVRRVKHSSYHTAELERTDPFTHYRGDDHSTF